MERVGRQIRALGVPEDSWFTAASVLVQYIVGAAGRNAVQFLAGVDLVLTGMTVLYLPKG